MKVVTTVSTNSNSRSSKMYNFNDAQFQSVLSKGTSEIKLIKLFFQYRDKKKFCTHIKADKTALYERQRMLLNVLYTSYTPHNNRNSKHTVTKKKALSYIQQRKKMIQNPTSIYNTTGLKYLTAFPVTTFRSGGTPVNLSARQTHLFV